MRKGTRFPRYSRWKERGGMKEKRVRFSGRVKSQRVACDANSCSSRPPASRIEGKIEGKGVQGNTAFARSFQFISGF